MESFKQLSEEFKVAVRNLQETCKHTEVSDWMEEYWAPGHGTNCEVKICNFCNKFVERRGSRPLIVDKGDGNFDATTRQPFSKTYYAADESCE